jgi:hypothetical protein
MASRNASHVSENSVNYICPKCRHRYSSGINSGPRAVCPECGYGPTLLEFGDEQRQSVWPVIFGLLAVAALIALVVFLQPT